MQAMMTKLATISFVALISLSPPQNPQDEVAALRREVQALREQQAQMQKELAAIKNFLQSLLQPRAQAGEMPGIVGVSIPTAGEPALGSATAKVTVMEVSDYHCPFCKRQTQQTFPQLQSEYVSTGKVRFVFVDYPIAQLHPTAHRAHEAAACAGDQGKFWEMHASLFAQPPTKSDSDLIAQAKNIGLDMGQFGTCLSGGKHAAAVKDSVARMEQLGIGGTPMTLIGLTPAPGQPMKVVKYIYGAKPFSEFKTAIDSLLQPQ
jgi:protein-disulfide isomerase